MSTAAAKLRGDVDLRVLLGDARLGLDDLRERPERDAVPVCQAAALTPGDQLWIRVDDPLQLIDEPALPDPRDADQREQLRRTRVSCTVEGVLYDGQLALTAYELRACLVGDVDSEARTSCDCRPDANGLGLTLRLDRRCRLEVDGGTGRAKGRLVDQDAVHWGGALQASGRVDDVARCHAFSCIGTRVERDERLTCRDPHAELEFFLEREVADRKGCANGALGIVLVRRRRAEQRHDRVPDELLDRAAVALELRANALVVGPKDGLDVLGIHRLGPRGEPHEVAEDDRHDLALSTRCGPRHGSESMTSTRSSLSRWRESGTRRYRT